MVEKFISTCLVLCGLEDTTIPQCSNFSFLMISRTPLFFPRPCSSNPSRISKHLLLNLSSRAPSFPEETPSPFNSGFCFYNHIFNCFHPVPQISRIQRILLNTACTLPWPNPTLFSSLEWSSPFPGLP